MSDATKRPRVVEAAVGILFAAFVIAIASSVAELPSVPDRGIVIGLLLSITALYLFNIYKIWAGRNWARLLYTVIFVLGCFKSVPQLSETLQESFFLGTGDAVLLAAQLTAVGMLYLPKSHAWFLKPASNNTFKVRPDGAPQLKR
jgi:hypothetical protein